MRTAFLSSFRFYLVFAAITCVFCSLAGRLVYLQAIKAPALRESAQSARRNFSTLQSRRGDIVDCKGNLLATTRSVVEIGVDPQSVVEEDLVLIPELARLLSLDTEEVRKAFLTKTRTGTSFDGEVRQVRWAKIADEVEEEFYLRVMNLGIKGVYGNYKHSRLYPGKNLASHVVGFVNKEGTAAMGIEQMTDYYLRGQDGWRETERDGRRRELLQFRTREIPPVDGLNIELSIDRMIQDIVERQLVQVVKEFSPLSASIIVSEPTSGYLLGMANAPDFDPNRFNYADMSDLRNRALTDLYEPGSVFKIVAVGGALNEGLVNSESIIDCSEAVSWRGGRKYRLPRDHHPLGKISVREVVAKSSNRGAAQLGIMLGDRRMYEYCRMFGFGRPTNLGARGERKGILHHPKNWDGLTITRLPMGHAVSVTPMQMHSAMAAVANDGILMKPQLIRRVFDSSGRTVVDFKPRGSQRVLQSDVSSLLTDMLVDVVGDNGTAKQAKVEGYEVAGKTGTTQKLVDGRYSNRHHVASFVGFLPADNPRVVVTVVVDEPKMKAGRIGYGGSVAAPAFGKVAKEIMDYLGVRPEKKIADLNDLGRRSR